MFVTFWAITYSTLFVGLLLIYLPARVLSWSGIVRPTAIEAPQIIGAIIGSAGAVVALSCVFTFVWIGRGTPAPFDPPRRLVSEGPTDSSGIRCTSARDSHSGGPRCSTSRRPCSLMAPSSFSSPIYSCCGTRNRRSVGSFGPDYEAYCRRVRRWWLGA